MGAFLSGTSGPQNIIYNKILKYNIIIKLYPVSQGHSSPRRHHHRFSFFCPARHSFGEGFFSFSPPAVSAPVIYIYIYSHNRGTLLLADVLCISSVRIFLQSPRQPIHIVVVVILRYNNIGFYFLRTSRNERENGFESAHYPRTIYYYIQVHNNIYIGTRYTCGVCNVDIGNNNNNNNIVVLYFNGYRFITTTRRFMDKYTYI